VLIKCQFHAPRASAGTGNNSYGGIRALIKELVEDIGGGKGAELFVQYRFCDGLRKAVQGAGRRNCRAQHWIRGSGERA